MFIPVVKVKAILDAVLAFIKADYDECLRRAREEESFLYRVLQGQTLSDYNFYTQGKDIFIRSGGSSRQLQTRMGFDVSMSSLPVVYVHQPSDMLKGVNTIGFGLDTNEYYTNSDDSVTEKLFRSFGSVFEYTIVSSNVLETVLIYEVLMAAMISVIDTLNEYFEQVSLSGKELIVKNELMPEPLFMKSIQLDVIHIKQVPRLTTPETLITAIEFGMPTLYTEDDMGQTLI